MKRKLFTCVLRSLLLTSLVLLPSLTSVVVTWFLLKQTPILLRENETGLVFLVAEETNRYTKGMIEAYGLELGLILNVLRGGQLFFFIFLFYTFLATSILKDEKDLRSLDLAFVIPIGLTYSFLSLYDILQVPSPFQNGFIIIMALVSFSWVCLARFYWNLFQLRGG